MCFRRLIRFIVFIPAYLPLQSTVVNKNIPTFKETLQKSAFCVLDVRPVRENSVHETSQPEPQPERKKTRKQVFLKQMEQVVPWAALVELIAPYYPEGKTGRPPFSLQTMLRIHFMQQWFTLSDPGMEEAFFDTPLYREFAQLEEFGRLPDEAPSCVSVTALKITNWLSKFWA
jgi:hypothetical protein